MSKNSSILFAWLLVVTALSPSCAFHKQHRTDLAETPFLGSASQNDSDLAAHRAYRTFEVYDEFALGHIEFDDQGKYWMGGLDPQTGNKSTQIDVLERHVGQQMKNGAYPNGVLMVVFAHGWHHDASEADENLNSFRKALFALSEEETEKPDGRKVLGVYLGWRGETIAVPGVNVATFWGRKEIAHNIGQRDMGETLARLADLRYKIAKQEAGFTNVSTMKSRIALVGHSFGAAAMYSAVSRFFVDELIELERSGYKDEVSRRWDLVVLANPAFEALRYEAIDRYTRRFQDEILGGFRPDKFSQFPRLIIASSENDGPNKKWLRVGQFLANFGEGHQEGAERDMMNQAAGQYEPFYTHDLKCAEKPCNGQKLVARPRAGRVPRSGNKAFQPFAALFESSEDASSLLPCMVLNVEKGIIGSHNDIWQDGFREFLVKFLVAREQVAN